MRIVDIELDRSEEILHPIVLDVAAVDEVLVLAPDDDLPGDDHLVVLLVAQRRPDQVNWLLFNYVPLY